MRYRTALWLLHVVYVSLSYNISLSWLYLLNCLGFYFFYLRDDVWGENHQYILDNVKGLNNDLPGINMYAFEVENKLEIIK